MKNFVIFLAFIISSAFVYIFGYNNPVIGINIGDLHYNVDLFIYALFAFFFGVAAGALALSSSLFGAMDNYRKLKRQYEKTAIGADDSDLRVKTLQNKIATLEEALKKALEK